MIDVTNDDEVLFARLEHFLILSGLGVQSRARLWRYCSRWVRRLRLGLLLRLVELALRFVEGRRRVEWPTARAAPCCGHPSEAQSRNP